MASTLRSNSSALLYLVMATGNANLVIVCCDYCDFSNHSQVIVIENYDAMCHNSSEIPHKINVHLFSSHLGCRSPSVPRTNPPEATPIASNYHFAQNIHHILHYPK